jgi:hypothetical protein
MARIVLRMVRRMSDAKVMARQLCAVLRRSSGGCRACVAYDGHIRNARMSEAVGCYCRYRPAHAGRLNRRFGLDLPQRDLPVPR